METIERRPIHRNRFNYTKAIMLSLALVIISGSAGFFLSPPGQRYLANQTAETPQTNVTRVMVRHDEALNHIFSPAVIEIEQGTTVTWEFVDIDEEGVPVLHNVVFDVVFDNVASPVIAEGEYSLTFNEVGTYDYVCTLHPFMDGRVIVVDG